MQGIKAEPHPTNAAKAVNAILVVFLKTQTTLNRVCVEHIGVIHLVNGVLNKVVNEDDQCCSRSDSNLKNGHSHVLDGNKAKSGQ